MPRDLSRIRQQIGAAVAMLYDLERGAPRVASGRRGSPRVAAGRRASPWPTPPGAGTVAGIVALAGWLQTTASLADPGSGANSESPMPQPLVVYLAVGLLVTLGSVAWLAVRRPAPDLFGRGYRRLLATPWKLATFALALVAFNVIAPLSGDPTWDYADATFMSVLAFTTAPWSVGVMHGVARRRLRPALLLPALSLWWFTAGGGYDLYILVRDRSYPPSWASNLALSSVLYLLAGLLWNLEDHPERGLRFGFFDADWPQAAPPRVTVRLALLGLPMVLIVAVAILAFLLPPSWLRWTG